MLKKLPLLYCTIFLAGCGNGGGTSDTTPPVITITGLSSISIIQGTRYTDAGATATDNADTRVNITTTGTVDTNVIGRYAVTYTSTDTSGNTATKTRTINVAAAPATLPRAHRLLVQTTFGPTQADLEYVQQVGQVKWIDEQLAKTSAYDNPSDKHRTHLERTVEVAKLAEPNTNWDDGGTTLFNQAEASFRADEYQMGAWWENSIGLHPTNTLHGSDQLRQRVAYALSQLLVTSAYEPPLFRRGEALAAYYDILARNAFGNYRALLGEMARSPTMGVYLSHQGNRKTNAAAGTRPDENFAREIMQLFTIGLFQLNNDGTPNRDNNASTFNDLGSNLVPSYSQSDIEELAKVMTGWDLVGNSSYGKSSFKTGDYTQAMQFTNSEHEQGSVTVLGKTFSLSSGTDNSGMDAALDVLFSHPNIGPFVSKHLIMRLVTSNPSAAYINRVATVFNNDGAGIRGNLKAVVRAILLDNEARNDAFVTTASFGKFKEPLLAWTQLLRATNAVPLNGWKGTNYNNDGTLVNGVYLTKHPGKYLGQAALRSPSVFNFYNPDYAPSNTAFTSRSLVGPEMQIQTDQMLLEYSNKVRTTLTSEKNWIKRTQTVTQYANSKGFNNDPLVLISFDEALATYKEALGGNLDNIGKIDTDGVAFRDKAADALINYFDQLLLGETMTDAYKAALKEYLVNANSLRHRDTLYGSMLTIQSTVLMIVTSSAYMIQK